MSGQPTRSMWHYSKQSAVLVTKHQKTSTPIGAEQSAEHHHQTDCVSVSADAHVIAEQIDQSTAEKGGGSSILCFFTTQGHVHTISRLIKRKILPCQVGFFGHLWRLWSWWWWWRQCGVFQAFYHVPLAIVLLVEKAESPLVVLGSDMGLIGAILWRN